ncbi:hypothetical protein NicSoilB4_11840 [Arthrobacter sp. NicSoilB4]|uniref:hypothetical protein n=1 Tax=Arthrobacter sp. NicSoilB4 TaxID=2830997 RepID=UPI001CC65B36|nr:hypothetical protein [Arthrobacter sp. NicSoilB4]BCW66421.1 hypothetical protein NicSoilB4_11840 [Arthrobacter sp. NicSoilB4]
MRRPLQAALAGLLACGLASGCTLLPPATSDVCVDWIRFETPQDQFDHAVLVLIGKPVRVDDETLMYGYKAKVHLVEIETVLKGDPGPAPLRVASTPATCSAGVSYPDGDPLEQSQRMLIFANKQEGGWSTQTPAQGAVPFETGAPLPFGTAAPKG